MPFTIHRHHTPEISRVAPAIDLRIAVNRFFPFARARQSKPVTQARDWRQIQDNGELAIAFRVLTSKGQNAVLVIGTVDPEEAAMLIIGLPQTGLADIKLVKVLNEPLQTFVIRTRFEPPPVE